MICDRVKRRILLIVLSGISVAIVNADDVQAWAFVTSSVGDTPRSTLPATTQKIWVIFETHGAKRGDKFRAVLIADQAGHIAPNSKQSEATAKLDGDTKDGGVSFNRPPDHDWPAGDYHVEIYINDQLVTSTKFAVEAK